MKISEIADPFQNREGLGLAQEDLLAPRKSWVAEKIEQLGRSRTKALIVTNSIGCGGEEHQVMRLIPELRALGFDVEHLYYCAPHTLEPKYKAKGIDSVFIDKNTLGQIKFWREMVKYIKANRFDVVHAFGGTANIYVKGAAILAGTRTILSGSRNRYLGGGVFCNLCTSLLNLFSNAWVMNASTNLDSLKELYYHGKPRAYVLPNALEFSDRDYVTPVPLDPGLKSWVNGRLVVASVGRLSYQKNFDMFLNVVRRVREVRKDACFTLVGEPVCTAEGSVIQDALQKRIQDESLGSYLKMTGRIDDIPSFLTNVDILVSTSRFEGCPNVVLEAMRAARPIVMTNSCDTRWIIQEGQNGYVVGLDDLDALVHKVQELLASDEKRKQFGDKSREIVEKNFTSTNAAWTLARIYLTELERQKR